MAKFMFPWVMGFVMAVLLSACASVGELKNQAMMRGFNVMQHENVGWNQPAARQSMRRMVAVGSNAIVVIAFLEQESATALVVQRSDAVTFAQLKKAIQYSHEFNLEVILKPQILVRNAWASAISHQQQGQWNTWFDSYTEHIVEYATFAEENRVQNFVIGTELSQASKHVDWPKLIRKVRAVFTGKITYAAHNVVGIEAFPYWHELDAVAVTMYPSLGEAGQVDEMQKHVRYAVGSLQRAVQDINLPLWVLEIGMPSATGASEKPWEWQSLKHARVDVRLQEAALALWLQALDQPWINAVFIWTWYSDAGAGGEYDADYTPQNKPAEQMIRRYWKF